MREKYPGLFSSHQLISCCASHWLPLKAKMQTTGISCLEAQEGEGQKMGPWRQMEMTAASKPGSSGGYCGFCADHGDNINIAIKQVAWIFWFHRVNKVVFQLYSMKCATESCLRKYVHNLIKNNTVGKMALIDLLYAGLPQLSVCKNALTVKYIKAKFQ